jgi:hypothetical protein
MNSSELSAKIRSIRLKLETANLIKYSILLENDVLSSGTPGERLHIVAHRLNSLKMNEEAVYFVIKDVADEIISYAKSINYL